MTGIQGKIARGFKGSAGKATRALGDEVNNNSGPFQQSLGKLGGLARNAGKAISLGLGLGVAGLAALTTKAVLSGAELEQQLGGAEAVFGEYADSIKTAAEDAYKNAGLSQAEFLQGANKMGSLFQGVGFDVETSMDMSAESMQRASDIASIMGISTEEALQAVTGMAKGNLTMMDNLGVAMNDTTLNAYALEKGLGKTTAQMSIQEKVGLAQQLFMEKTAKFAGNYAKENETLSGSLNTTKKAFDNLMTGEGDVDDFIDSLIDTINIAIPKIVKLLPKLVKGIAGIIKALVPALEEVLPTLVPAVIEAIVSLLNALVAAFPTIVRVLLNALPILVQAIIDLFLAILQALPEIIRIISDALPEIVDAIVTGLTAPESLQAILMAAVELLLAIVEAIPTIIEALVAAVPEIISNLFDTLTDPKFLGQMKDAGIQLISSMISGIGSMLSDVWQAATDIFKKVADVLSVDNFIAIGVNLVKGIWQGIQDMGQWIYDNIIQWVKDKIPGPVKFVLGISSPSKLAAELGKEVPRGLALGIEKNSGEVTKAADAMANNALAGIAAPLVGPSVAFGGVTGAAVGASGGNTTNNQSVNIQKLVLADDSAVREFFMQLNQDTINVGMGITPNQGATA